MCDSLALRWTRLLTSCKRLWWPRPAEKTRPSSSRSWWTRRQQRPCQQCRRPAKQGGMRGRGECRLLPSPPLKQSQQGSMPPRKVLKNLTADHQRCGLRPKVKDTVVSCLGLDWREREREKGKKNPEECGLRNSPCICMDVRGEGEGFSALVPLVGLEAREFLFILMSELRQKKKKKKKTWKKKMGLWPVQVSLSPVCVMVMVMSFTRWRLVMPLHQVWLPSLPS